MNKKVTFTPKPPTNLAPVSADVWVSGGNQGDAQESKEKGRAEPQTDKTKRFTIDVPESLHRRVKVRCAEKGVDMNVEIRRLLDQHFPPF